VSVLPVRGEQAPHITRGGKLLFLAIAAVVYGLGLVAALPWTPIGSEYIAGAQGRYFLPIMPLLFLLATNTLQRKTNNGPLLLFIMMLINAYATLYLFQAAL
jgi:uncharacterized membrane protein